MGFTTILLCTFAAFLVVFTVQSATGSPSCPPPSSIYDYSKKEQCHDHSQCSGGKICCRTPAGNKACVLPGYGMSAALHYDKGKTTATGTYCGNKKCSPSERCVKDQSGRYVCRRW